MKLNLDLGFAVIATETLQVGDHEGNFHDQDFVVVKKKNVIAIVMEDLNSGDHLFVKQFRPGTHFNGDDDLLMEIVAGHIDKGQDKIKAAVEEVKQETGATVKLDDIKYLGAVYSSPGIMTEKIHLFYCKVDKNDIQQFIANKEEKEFIEVVWLNKKQIKEYIMDAKYWSAIALLNF